MSGKGKATSASRKAYYLSRMDGKVQAANKQRRLLKHLRSHPHDKSAVNAIKMTRFPDNLLGAHLIVARDNAMTRHTKRVMRKSARHLDAALPRM